MMKETRRLLAMGLSACLIAGSAMTTFAAEDDGLSVDAPIYSMNITNVVVPTSFAMAFNPQGYDITVAPDTTVNDQVVSLNYGVINKSSADKTMMISFTAEDLNTTAGGSMIEFVDSAEAIADAEQGEYKVYLSATPVTIDAGVTLDKDSAAADLVGFDGEAVSGGDVAIVGSGMLGFNLEKATYEQKAGATIGLADTSGNDVTSNDISDKFELTAITADGVAAFTLGGAMNTNTDWTKITEGIKVGVVYEFTDTTHADPDAPVYGVTEVGPTFTSTQALVLNYTTGGGELTDIVKVTADYQGTETDIYAYMKGGWAAATDADGTITFASALTGFWTGDTVAVKVYYETGTPDGVADKTANATLKLR